MNLTDLLLTVSQAEVEVPSLFPFPFKMHLIFSIIAFVFLIGRFAKEKYPYQLIIGIAAPLSLLIHVSADKTLFYAVGAVEAVLIIAAIISSFIVKKPEENSSKKDEGKKTEETQE